MKLRGSLFFFSFLIPFLEAQSSSSSSSGYYSSSSSESYSSSSSTSSSSSYSSSSSSSSSTSSTTSLNCCAEMYRFQSCSESGTSMGSGYLRLGLPNQSGLNLPGYFYVTRNKCKSDKNPIWSRSESDYDCEGDPVVIKLYEEEVSLGKVKNHTECKGKWEAAVKGTEASRP